MPRTLKFNCICKLIIFVAGITRVLLIYFKIIEGNKQVDDFYENTKTRWANPQLDLMESLGMKIPQSEQQHLRSFCKGNYRKKQLNENRLGKEHGLKDTVWESLCELQLAMEQDEYQYHFIHSIYEIERSPLGCIFRSYIFMSKRFNYLLIQNCKDIVQNLKISQKEEDKKTLTAANYIIVNLFL